MSPRRRAPDVRSGAVAVLVLIARRFRKEWRATRIYDALLSRPRAAGVAAAARDPRPLDPELGRHMLQGRLALAGASMPYPPGALVFEKACPSRGFAVELHRFAWLPSLVAAGPAGVREALRLTLDWDRLFGRVRPFAWSAETLERRVFNLACAMRSLAGAASDREAGLLARSLARQARHLLNQGDGLFGGAPGAAVAALAGAVLGGRAGARIERRAMERLIRRLPEEVFADGGVKGRSPQAALELLFDLLALDDVLLANGRDPPEAVSQALDRLSLGARFFRLGDRRLAAFHGGEAASAERVLAALAHGDAEAAPPAEMPYGGYQRLQGRDLLVIVDAAPPPSDAFSRAACAQPLAVEITAGGDRLVANGGWSPDAAGFPAFRLTSAGSTATVGDFSAGRLLSGLAARAFGPRLVAGAATVDVLRRENEHGVWLELSHDAYAEPFGILHQRRLFLDARLDELRGEDRFLPAETAARFRRPPGFTVRFHLPPDIQVSLARDRRSVLLRGPSNRGWWFRNDAPEVQLEPSTLFEKARPHRGAQVVLKGGFGAAGGVARVRWKIAPVEPSDRKGAVRGASRSVAAAEPS